MPFAACLAPGSHCGPCAKQQEWPAPRYTIASELLAVPTTLQGTAEAQAWQFCARPPRARRNAPHHCTRATAPPAAPPWALACAFRHAGIRNGPVMATLNHRLLVCNWSCARVLREHGPHAAVNCVGMRVLLQRASSRATQCWETVGVAGSTWQGRVCGQ